MTEFRLTTQNIKNDLGQGAFLEVLRSALLGSDVVFLQEVQRRDLERAAKALEALAAPAEVGWEEWTAGVQADYHANLEPTPAPGPLDMAQVVKTLQSVLEEHGFGDAVLTNGAGNYSGWLHRYYRYPGFAAGNRTQLAPTSGAMGYGVPAAVAAMPTYRPAHSTHAGSVQAMNRR